MKNILSVLPGLSLLPIYIYIWSNNISEASGKDYLASSLVLLCFFIVSFCFCRYFVIFLIDKFIKDKYQHIFICLFIAGLTALFLFYIIDYHIYLQRRLWGVVAAAIIFILLYFNFSKVLATFFAVLLIITSSKFAYTYISTTYKSEEIIRNQLQDYKAIDIVKTPNIYVYILESYQSVDSLQNIFKFDTKPFTKYLEDRNFVILPHNMSSGSYTMQSIAQLFLTRNFESLPNAWNLEALWISRDIVSGSPYNYVYRTLKNNGYRTYFITTADHSYYLQKKGPYLDEITFETDFINNFLYPIYAYFFQSIKNFFDFHSALNRTAYFDYKFIDGTDQVL